MRGRQHGRSRGGSSEGGGSSAVHPGGRAGERAGRGSFHAHAHRLEGSVNGRASHFFFFLFFFFLSAPALRFLPGWRERVTGRPETRFQEMLNCSLEGEIKKKKSGRGWRARARHPWHPFLPASDGAIISAEGRS